jgi:hypothetical protein
MFFYYFQATCPMFVYILQATCLEMFAYFLQVTWPMVLLQATWSMFVYLCGPRVRCLFTFCRPLVKRLFKVYRVLGFILYGYRWTRPSNAQTSVLERNSSENFHIHSCIRLDPLFKSTWAIFREALLRNLVSWPAPVNSGVFGESAALPTVRAFTGPIREIGNASRFLKRSAGKRRECKYGSLRVSYTLYIPCVYLPLAGHVSDVCLLCRPRVRCLFTLQATCPMFVYLLQVTWPMFDYLCRSGFTSAGETSRAGSFSTRSCSWAWEAVLGNKIKKSYNKSQKQIMQIYFSRLI